MARLPEAEHNYTCPMCGLGWCPDLDDEGLMCACSGYGNDFELTPNRSVDEPVYRPKPRRRRKRSTAQRTPKGTTHGR